MTNRARLATYLAVACAALAAALLLTAPSHSLKVAGAVLFACAPIGAALVYRLDAAQARMGGAMPIATVLVCGALACGATAWIVHEHDVQASMTPASEFLAKAAEVQPRSWHGTPQPLGVSGKWRLILNSQFNGTSLDTSIWRPGWLGSGVTSPANVLEDDCYSSSNVTFPGDGTVHLNITASPSHCGGHTYPYTGALLSTNPNDGRRSGGFQYTFGALEARVYLPADGNLLADWPIVWTNGQHWPLTGEDDVLEGLFGYACFHFHSLHFEPHGPGACVTGVKPGWHTFASVWRPGSVAYYYDGVYVGTVTQGVTSSPMYIILSNTVWDNTPKTTRPDSMRVAYVRVWKQVTG